MSAEEELKSLAEFLLGPHSKKFSLKPARGGNLGVMYRLTLHNRTPENLALLRGEVTRRFGEPNEKQYQGRELIDREWGHISIMRRIKPEHLPPDALILIRFGHENTFRRHYRPSRE